MTALLKSEVNASKATKKVAKVAKPAETPDWLQLLDDAANLPGLLSDSYRFFKKYSCLNRFLAGIQLHKMGLPLLPINTYGTKDAETGKGKSGWLGVGRQVQAGQKASIALIRPIPIKVKKKETEEGEDGQLVINKFVLAKAWFHLNQTEGEEFVVEEMENDDWSMATALDMFDVTEVEFEFSNTYDIRQGYATGQSIAVSPLAEQPVIARVTQLARIVLGHTEAVLRKRVPVDKDSQDIEAMVTAYLIAATLGFSGMDELRFRVQAILKESVGRISEQMASRSFGAAEKILNAGRCK